MKCKFQMQFDENLMNKQYFRKDKFISINETQSQQKKFRKHKTYATRTVKLQSYK